jgi:hypothetical protein
VHDLVDVGRIVARLVTDMDRDRGTAVADKGRQEMRRQVLEDEAVASREAGAIFIVTQTLEADMEKRSGLRIGRAFGIIVDLILVGETEAKFALRHLTVDPKDGPDMHVGKAVEPEKAAYSLAADAELVVGICGGEGLPIMSVQAVSIILDGRPDTLLFTVGRHSNHDSPLSGYRVAEARLGGVDRIADRLEERLHRACDRRGFGQAVDSLDEIRSERCHPTGLAALQAPRQQETLCQAAARITAYFRVAGGEAAPTPWPP